MTDVLHDTTLAILAGGLGERMGQAKGELRLGDQPILAYLLDHFAWQGPTLLVTAPGREHPPAWERFDAEAVDPVGDLGPLRGVLTALEHAKTARVIVTTVDMPGVGSNQFEWLGQRLSEQTESLAVMTLRDGRVEPFPSIYRVAAAPMVRQQLEARSLSVGSLTRQTGVVAVPAPQEWGDDVWTNLNRPEDLQAFTRRSFRSDR